MSRNLLEYPITKEEVIGIIEGYAVELPEHVYGGEQPYILSRLIKLVEREFRHEDFNPPSLAPEWTVE
jgi:hypothetical protein